jgi:hypothetical protein
VNVLVDAVRGALLSEPAVARLPVQAPEAVQEAAFVEDQVRVEDAPLATDVGFAASNTVGSDGGGVPPTGVAMSAWISA